jgi:nitroreductase
VFGSRGKSPAHTLQNMWLKAIALGLGFQLISTVTDSEDNEKLSALLDVTHREFNYDACIIGYPALPVSPEVRDIPHLSIRWFD